MIKVFISYSCGDQSHEAWVGQLADILEQDSDFHVTLDQYDLDRFKDKNKFMEDAVFDSDFMIVVATSDYKRKADTRTRGVGIESQLAAQRHYKESGESASSDIIVLAREPDSVPHYLSSKLYIDFIDDSKFNKSVKELINSLKGTALRKRPSKVDNNFINDLTRIEDILKIVYKKRSILIDKKSGTDFSNGNKIKYELWEVKTPKTEHILILYKNISIDDTFKRLKSETLKKNIIINSLTVIRIDNRQSAQVSKYLKIHFDKVNLTELTLKHFITDYCIDYDYTSRHEVWEEPYFIDQLIYSIDSQDSKELAIPLLMEKIKSPTNSSAHVIIAEGGDGKSSLCSSLVNEINSKPQEFDKSAILLRVDEIRNRISTDIISSFSIKNIYDIYNLFSQLLVDERGPASYPKISSNDFEVRVFSGSLVVIIDGLDELYSIFQDKFEKKEFLESLQSLNDQLGESSVILTSRGNIFSEISNYKDTLDIYYLKGFNRKECASYFTKRFRGEDNKTKIISQCNRDVSELMEATKVEKISPFVVDLISHSNTELPPEENDDGDIDYISSKKTYPSNSEFTDKIVYQILVREELRQNVHISIQEVVNLFCEIASEYGSSISEDKLREMCAIYYESQSNSVYDNLIANPLLLSERGVVTFRYHFLHDYFLTLYIIDGLLNKKTDLHFIKAISKYAKGSTSAYLDILNYFKNHNEINFPHILNKLKQVYNEKEGKHLERSISFVIHLMIDLHEKNPSKSDISKTILDNFTISENNQMIENLFIYGDTLPLDFSHHIFRKCGFYSYPSFENCNFEHAFFSYSTVDIDIDNFKNKTINSQTFDSTCQTGKLSKYLSNHEGSNAQSEAGKDENLKRFFRNFMSQNSFVDIDLEELIFPTEQLSDRSPFFREAISQRIIYLNDENHCGISNLYRKPVQNYITNGVMDQKIYKVLVKL